MLVSRMPGSSVRPAPPCGAASGKNKDFLLLHEDAGGFFDGKGFLLFYENRGGRPGLRFPATLGNQAGVTRTREAAGHPS